MNRQRSRSYQQAFRCSSGALRELNRARTRLGNSDLLLVVLWDVGRVVASFKGEQWSAGERMAVVRIEESAN